MRVVQGGTKTGRSESLFLRSGIIWQLCARSYWVLFFTRVVVDLELPAVQLLLLGTIKETTILLAEIPTGVVADLRSRRTSVILGFLVTWPWLGSAARPSIGSTLLDSTNCP